MPQVYLNWLPVLGAAVINMVIGAAWYSPKLFGKQWLRAIGWSQEELESRKKGAQRAYVLSFVGSLVIAAVLQHFVYFTRAKTALLGAKTGFWMWLGFVVPVLLAGCLWEGKPFKLFKINAGYYLVSLVVLGAVLAVWR